MIYFPLRGPVPTPRTVGPILLTREAESIRKELATWASADRIPGEDYTVDYHGHRVYEVSKVEYLVGPLLRVLNREGRRYRMFRSSITKQVSAYSETYVIPIQIVSDDAEILYFHSGTREKIKVGYYYILGSDVYVTAKLDFLVIGDGPRELSGPNSLPGGE